MKSRLLLLGAAALLLASCSDELDAPNSMAEGDSVPLTINVTASPETKTQIQGTLLPKDAEIGVFVTKNDGTAYPSVKAYDNIKYTGSGTTYSETWTIDPEVHQVLLSTEKATAYAYYPRIASGVTLTSVPISNDGTDWMYSAPVADLNIWNSTANFSMVHAMTILRISISRASESDAGTISKVTIDSDSWATNAEIDLRNSTVGSYTGVGSQMVKNNVGSLSATPLTYDHWVIPTDAVSDLTFEVHMDDQWYYVSVPDVSFLPGKVYNYNLTISTKSSLIVNSVQLTDWDSSNSMDMETEVFLPPAPIADTWAGLTDGVYLVRPDFKPAAVPAVADVGVLRCIGVGLVNASNNQYFMIEKHENKNPIYVEVANGRSSEYFYWGGYGTNQSSITDCSTFSDALSDFAGATWSNYLVSVLTGGPGSTNYATIGAVLKAFREANHLGKSTWYIPSGGQLYLIYQNLSAVNAAIEKIGGTKIQTTSYWTSSEVDDTYAFYYYLSSSSISSTSKVSGCRLRLLVNL